jgi:hypothetical protein
LTRQFPLLDESLQKLKDADAENENLQEHAKIIESMKQSLIQAVRYSQSVALDVDGLSSKVVFNISLHMMFLIICSNLNRVSTLNLHQNNLYRIIIPKAYQCTLTITTMEP